MSLETRLKTYLSVRNNISKTVYSESKTDSLPFSSFIKYNGNNLDGKFGDVRFGKIKNTDYEVALKIVPVTWQEFKQSLDQKYTIWREINNLKLASHLITKRICPNLPLLCSYGKTKNCSFLNKKYKNNKSPPCTYILTDKFDGTLLDLFRSKQLSLKEWKSIIFQVMCGLHSIENKFQMIHGDLQWKNILYKKIKKENFAYIINDLEYIIYTEGYLISLSDFGSSHREPALYQINTDMLASSSTSSKNIATQTNNITSKEQYLLSKYSKDMKKFLRFTYYEKKINKKYYVPKEIIKYEKDMKLNIENKKYLSADDWILYNMSGYLQPCCIGMKVSKKYVKELKEIKLVNNIDMINRLLVNKNDNKINLCRYVNNFKVNVITSRNPLIIENKDIDAFLYHPDNIIIKSDKHDKKIKKDYIFKLSSLNFINADTLTN